MRSLALAPAPFCIRCGDLMRIDAIRDAPLDAIGHVRFAAQAPSRPSCSGRRRFRRGSISFG